MSYESQISCVFGTLGVALPQAPHGITVRSPIDGNAVAVVPPTGPTDFESIVAAAQARARGWRDVPAPQRGALVRALGEKAREHKEALGRLVTIETGKILQEGLGEVQEVIDICEFALGLSRQLYGLTIASERPDHKLLETWHPLGVVGVISAFNFPMAVWAWNAALALVCGNTLVCKFSEKTPLSALAEGTLIGPLVDDGAFQRMQAALEAAKAAGGIVHCGDRVNPDGGGWYARPALVEMPAQTGPMLEETFAPILYVLPCDTLEQAIEWNNAAAHGLSSSVFTRDLLEAEIFTSARGSDCGIANVNIGTSGAEIGGEKETGGGRESGSDAWKNYMRRATNTINYGTSLPLAQGIRFEV